MHAWGFHDDLIPSNSIESTSHNGISLPPSPAHRPNIQHPADHPMNDVMACQPADEHSISACFDVLGTLGGLAVAVLSSILGGESRWPPRDLEDLEWGRRCKDGGSRMVGSSARN
jgi:hypothetical protein